jgi:hypothetical protein
MGLRHTLCFLALDRDPIGLNRVTIEILRFEHDLVRKPVSTLRDHALARVQAAENAGLFGLPQGDVGKVFGAPKVLVET